MLSGSSGSDGSQVEGEIHSAVCPGYLDGGWGFGSSIAPQSAAMAVKFPL